MVQKWALEYGADESIISTHYQHGGKGAVELAESVRKLAKTKPTARPLYELEDSLEDKLNALATKVYGRKGIELHAAARDSAKIYEEEFKNLPLCAVRSPFSFHSQMHHEILPVRELRLQAGAGMIIVECGPDYRTMPSLPTRPRFVDMGVHDGQVFGL